MLEKFTIQNWSSSTCSDAWVCSPRTLSIASVKAETTPISFRRRPGTSLRTPGIACRPSASHRSVARRPHALIWSSASGP